jgi:hypothetical protein
MKQPYSNKFTTQFLAKTYVVKRKIDNCVVIESPEGVQYRRNVTHLMKYEMRPEAMTEPGRKVRVESMSRNTAKQQIEENLNQMTALNQMTSWKQMKLANQITLSNRVKLLNQIIQ